MNATLTKPRIKTDAEEQSAGWTPSKWSLQFPIPLGQRIAELMVHENYVVLCYRNQEMAQANPRRQIAGEEMRAALLALAREELAASVVRVRSQAARQGLTDTPAELRLSEATVAELEGRKTRLELDPAAGHSDRRRSPESPCRGRAAPSLHPRSAGRIDPYSRHP